MPMSDPFIENILKPQNPANPPLGKNKYTDSIPISMVGSGDSNLNLTLGKGFIRSKGFISGKVGYILNDDGSAEFQNVNIGFRQISVAPGSDIQVAIDKVSSVGGGKVFLKNGTHLPASNLTLPDNVILEGESYLGTVLDFSAANYGIIVEGTVPSPRAGVVIRNMTIQNNGTANLIYLHHILEIELYDVVLQGGGTALSGDDILTLVITNLASFNNNYGINLSNFNTLSFKTVVVDDTLVGDGVIFTNGTQSTWLDGGVNNAAGNGMTFTNLTSTDFVSFFVSGNGANGIELVSGCSGCNIDDFGISGNGADGIKITATSSKNIVKGCLIENNTGYGINIANANCANNIIGLNIIDSNTAGQTNDLGTTTKWHGNIGKADT